MTAGKPSKGWRRLIKMQSHDGLTAGERPGHKHERECSRTKLARDLPWAATVVKNISNQTAIDFDKIAAEFATVQTILSRVADSAKETVRA